MYYFSLITSDYCKTAEIGLMSLFRHNDIVLHLFVVDDGYDIVCDYFKDKDYRDKLDIINFYNKEYNDKLFSTKHINIDFDTRIAHLTLWTFKILDYIPDDVAMRLDLDVLYFEKIEGFDGEEALIGQFELEYTDQQIRFFKLAGRITPQRQINVGLCKFNKPAFKITSFTDEFEKRLPEIEKYYIPEQDILNLIAPTVKYYTHMNIISGFGGIESKVDFSKKVLAVHFNGSTVKPWDVNYDKKAFKITKLVGLLKLIHVYANKYNWYKDEINKNYEALCSQKTSKEYNTAEYSFLSIINKLINKLKEW